MADGMRHHPHHDPMAGEIPVPHGPETGDEHVHYPDKDLSPDEQQRLFQGLIHPEDMYTRDGRYWADLPLMERVKFVNRTSNEEASREWAGARKAFGNLTWGFLPIAPVRWYFKNAVLPGAGLGLEGYVLFSIGNLETLFGSVWPQCWGKEATVCSHDWKNAITYLEIAGIMVGQVFVGVLGDWIGRRHGLIQDAVIMCLGLIGLTAVWGGGSLENWIIAYGWLLFFYGIGVGGEYPITATSSMENAVGAGKVSTSEDRLHRGRKVTMAFLMQGWGQFFNQVILMLVLLWANGNRPDPPYSEYAAQLTMRLSFGAAAVGTTWLVWYRWKRMPNASRQLMAAKAKNSVTGYDLTSFTLVLRHFPGRIIATAGTWFCNDVFFYGNKLFQGQFIKVVTDNPDSTITVWEWNLLNIVISMVGYYLASFLIDHKLYGRKWMMIIGFLVCFICFVVPGYNYEYYSSPAGIKAFQTMYFLSSFFNQFGPNSVTFLVAAEVFPTAVRASAHGFSAMIGKAGALVATIVYGYMSTQERFHFVPWFGLAGVVLTWLFLPDTTGLDLKEQERRWAYIREGRGQDYHGIAVNKQHLSAWEIIRGVHKSYDQAADDASKIEDLRAEWEARRAASAAKDGGEGQLSLDDEDDLFSEHVHRYFAATSSEASRKKGHDILRDRATDGGSTEVVNEKQVPKSTSSNEQ